MYTNELSAVPKKLARPGTVNKRRKEMGLEPIEEYLKMATEVHKSMNQRK
jgi:hypothetical protein